MQNYKKSIRSVAHILNTLEKSGGLTTQENLFISNLLKKLMRAIHTKNERLLRKTIDEICKVFVRKVRR